LLDLRAIDHWLSSNGTPSIATTTLTAIRARANLLEHYPRIGRTGPGDSRILRVRRTPYLLFYRIAADRIEILRIRHDREGWQA